MKITSLSSIILNLFRNGFSAFSQMFFFAMILIIIAFTLPGGHAWEYFVRAIVFLRYLNIHVDPAGSFDFQTKDFLIIIGNFFLILFPLNIIFRLIFGNKSLFNLSMETKIIAIILISILGWTLAFWGIMSSQNYHGTLAIAIFVYITFVTGTILNTVINLFLVELIDKIEEKNVQNV